MQTEPDISTLPIQEIDRIGDVVFRLGIGHGRETELAELTTDWQRFHRFEKNGLLIFYGDSSGDAIVGFAPGQDNNSAQKITMLLDAIEDFIVLVEADIFPKPDTISNYTNDRMARFATRFGFGIDQSQSEPDNRLVFATFDSLKAAILSISPERKQRLRQRAAANV